MMTFESVNQERFRSAVNLEAKEAELKVKLITPSHDASLKKVCTPIQIISMVFIKYDVISAAKFLFLPVDYFFKNLKQKVFVFYKRGWNVCSRENEAIHSSNNDQPQTSLAQASFTSFNVAVLSFGNTLDIEFTWFTAAFLVVDSSRNLLIIWQAMSRFAHTERFCRIGNRGLSFKNHEASDTTNFRFFVQDRPKSMRALAVSSNSFWHGFHSWILEFDHGRTLRKSSYFLKQRTSLALASNLLTFDKFKMLSRTLPVFWRVIIQEIQKPSSTSNTSRIKFATRPIFHTQGTRKNNLQALKERVRHTFFIEYPISLQINFYTYSRLIGLYSMI